MNMPKSSSDRKRPLKRVNAGCLLFYLKLWKCISACFCDGFVKISTQVIAGVEILTIGAGKLNAA